MKYQVLISMLFMLLSHKKVSAQAISERFGLSRRTVYRYIDELSLANIPILCQRGKYGGFYIAESYKLPASFFSPKEFKKLQALILAFKNQFVEDSELDEIIDKLSATIKQDRQSMLTTPSLIIDSSAWNDTSAYSSKLSTLSKAIENCFLAEIVYHNSEGRVTKRTVEPHALVFKQGLWYVYAYCRLREDFRLFKVGRIEYINTFGGFEKRAFEKNLLPFNEWYSKQPKEDVLLEVAPEIKSDIEEWLGIDSVYTLKNGNIRAFANLPIERGLVYEIMKYGKKLKVLKPTKLREEIILSAKELVAAYQTS